jgi:hypothetical protein
LFQIKAAVLNLSTIEDINGSYESIKMKQIIALLSTAILACNTHAAIITINVEGTFSEWYTKSQIPNTTDIIVEHFLTANPNIDVIGSISYDDSYLDPDTLSYTMTGLSLSQVGSLVASTADNDTITISGLSWNFSGGNTINQASGSASCVLNNTRCAETAAAINSSGSNSPFEFDGVSAGFPIGEAEQVEPADGFAFDSYNAPTYYIVTESDQVSPSGQDFNSLHNGLFTLTPTVVPVPAAAWLMGSGLIGLTAVARRRRV